MKVNESRKSTHSIMNHQRFGGVLLKQENFEMFIPKEWIFKKTGAIKKYGLKQIEKAKAQHEIRKAI